MPECAGEDDEEEADGEDEGERDDRFETGGWHFGGFFVCLSFLMFCCLSLSLLRFRFSVYAGGPSMRRTLV